MEGDDKGSWPRVPDADGEHRHLQKQIDDLLKRVRLQLAALILVSLGLLAAGSAFGYYVVHAAELRTEQFCATSRAAILAATPDRPVPEVLVRLYAASNCRPPLPPVPELEVS